MESIYRLKNCYLLRNHSIILEDLWFRNGVILDPLHLFFEEQKTADIILDLEGALIAPGLIDLQINGGFGVDFTENIHDPESGLKRVSIGLLSHGVTSFCPTLTTSPKETYHQILPFLKVSSKEGQAQILGAHLEGPFISSYKNGAHPLEYIRSLFGGLKELQDFYGPHFNSSHVRILTVAPEIVSSSVIKELKDYGLIISLGHTLTTFQNASLALNSGASLITHMFNSMSAFHHRSDPGCIGLLTSNIFYGLISDGVHSHPEALRIAYKTNFEGLCLVTDAISALGLSTGTYKFGGSKEFTILSGNRAVINGSKDTLCGAMTSLFEAIQIFKKGSRCSEVEALEAATLHPAKALGIEKKKGTLDFGSDADFIVIKRSENKYTLLSTWIHGKCVYSSN